ncbi:MAG: tetratricopeptide repeat protein [Candidatus Dadabacteria bacterium]|nr:tetratricopeptide repeat protein [Candidatus Dadabacteria bacterium]
MNPAVKLTLALIVFVIPLGGCAALYGSLYTDDPLTAEEHNDLGVIYEREGKHDLAIREYKRAIAIDGSLVTPLVNLGNVYMKEGEYTEAEKYYRKALDRDPHSIDAANNLASLYLETGKDYKEGLDVLLAAAPRNEMPAYALDTLGMLYLGLGETDKAVESLKGACTKAAGDDALRAGISANLVKAGAHGECN